MAASRSQTSRQAAPDVTPAASITQGPFRYGVPASGRASAACPSRRVHSATASRPPAAPPLHVHQSVPSLRHEDGGGLGGDLPVDDDLARRVALAAFLAGEAAAD